jgi:hypothetical protein
MTQMHIRIEKKEEEKEKRQCIRMQGFKGEV